MRHYWFAFMDALSRQCASEILETVPVLMRVLRAKARSKSGPELSIPQFRALAFLGRNKAAMLSDVAAFLGLTASAASKLVDGLVEAGFALRQESAEDRRKLELTLTATGRKKYAQAVKTAEDFIADRISHLSTAARSEVLKAMKTLRSAFHAPPELERQASSGSIPPTSS